MDLQHTISVYIKCQDAQTQKNCIREEAMQSQGELWTSESCDHCARPGSGCGAVAFKTPWGLDWSWNSEAAYKKTVFPKEAWALQCLLDNAVAYMVH